MKYTKATNYALHTIYFLSLVPKEKAVSVKPLAEIFNVSPTYLSKIITKLVKAGYLDSTPGVKGGYKLAQPASDITFLDIIHTIEGKAALFKCNIDGDYHAPGEDHCLIQEVMDEAESKMEELLNNRTIADLPPLTNQKILSYMESQTT
ncbi:Rrf2 family transcriptional regulator [Halobacillus litoralis]|uniref:Rrf2 family transcriptional regulator n=1 Tax=Halobacillus litoralis TaxID=45668 RepID=A0A845E2S5_9BACI|nr:MULTISPECIES: Rrf2 family transcriptional regulator [Halobacillus]MYL20577.1 Rrf2 family transcriptional regulator [Halobacillus litoralis]MYL29667.1 Rrf2 family transcriptional regulator [Halobacillus halophilus]MYL36884.1 Rrf2 family transcriptional regulator [Halobacillus litoralis]